MGTMDKIEEYLESLEEFVYTSIPDLPDVRGAINQLWIDITRYGPNLSEVHIPGLGDFEVPPPPPPPPPPLSFIEETADWVGKHPWEATGIAAGVVGAGLLTGYGGVYMRTLRARRIKSVAHERRQVVVVLGGDTPFALPLIHDLEKKGFIVITSVSTPEAVDSLEHRCHGFVRALVLDPSAPETISVFLRSLSSTLSRRFPINSAGDPFAPSSSHSYIHSIVSLLTLSGPTVNGPLEHLSLQNAYLPYLTATQITPLQVIQALLPLMRSSPAKGNKNIIICLPATETRVGLPFSAIQSMSAASTLRAAEVLRREIRVAALTGKSEFMKNIRVVVVDVGAFDLGPSFSSSSSSSHNIPPEEVYKAMEKWTQSEKLTYGPAFASILQQSSLSKPKSRWETLWSVLSFKDEHHYGIPRKRTNTKVFVDNIVGIVSNGSFGPSLFGFGFGIGQLRNWLRGERFSVGAGAHTYKYASYLPSLILDTLLNIPHYLITARNGLLPVRPFVRPPAPPSAAAAPVKPTTQRQITATSSQPESEPEESSNNEHSEAGSEADVESNSDDHDGTGGSWVSLKKTSEDEAAVAAGAET